MRPDLDKAIELAMPVVDQIVKIIDGNDGVTQQVIIEVLMARHAHRVGGGHEHYVIDSMGKHAKQFLPGL